MSSGQAEKMIRAVHLGLRVKLLPILEATETADLALDSILYTAQEELTDSFSILKLPSFSHSTLQ